MTTHSNCRSYISNDCTFGVLQPIYLPPHAVSIPRTEVPMEAIIGVQVRSRSTPLTRDYSCRKYSITSFRSFFLSFSLLHLHARLVTATKRHKQREKNRFIHASMNCTFDHESMQFRDHYCNFF